MHAWPFERGNEIYCKAWPVRNGNRYAKTAFQLDWERMLIRCPGDLELPFEPGGTVHFLATSCAACGKREQCTTSRRGRSVSIHPDERLLAEPCAPAYTGGQSQAA